MKKIAAWTLLAIYLNASAQMLLPFVSDCVAHLLFWENHLEHVHHGQIHSHHVAAELSALTGDDHQHPGTPQPAVNFEKDVLSAHVVSMPECPPLVVPTRPALLRPDWRCAYQSVVAEVLSPPPNRA